MNSDYSFITYRNLEIQSHARSSRIFKWDAIEKFEIILLNWSLLLPRLLHRLKIFNLNFTETVLKPAYIIIKASPQNL